MPQAQLKRGPVLGDADPRDLQILDAPGAREVVVVLIDGELASARRQRQGQAGQFVQVICRICHPRHAADRSVQVDVLHTPSVMTAPDSGSDAAEHLAAAEPTHPSICAPTLPNSGNACSMCDEAITTRMKMAH